MMPFYECDNITIYCGDCLEVMPQLEGSFDAIIADLPYGTTACDWDDIIPLEPLWMEYKRLIKDKGAIVLFGSQPFTSKLVASNLEWFKWEDIWDKKMPVGFLDANRKPMRRHENLLMFCDGLPIYNPQFTGGEPYSRPPQGALPKVYGSFTRKHKDNPSGDRYPTSIIPVSNADQTKKRHPTQKPLALLRYLIRTYTNPGDLILDNTMGSGTTLVAAQIEGRRAVGIDISEKYCQIAVDRLKPPGFLALLQDGKKEAQQVGLLE